MQILFYASNGNENDIYSLGLQNGGSALSVREIHAFLEGLASENNYGDAWFASFVVEDSLKDGNAIFVIGCMTDKATDASLIMADISNQLQAVSFLLPESFKDYWRNSMLPKLLVIGGRTPTKEKSLPLFFNTEEISDYSRLLKSYTEKEMMNQSICGQPKPRLMKKM